MKAFVKVGLRPGVLDVQGKAVAGALQSLGFDGVTDVRIGKIIELDLEGGDETDARARVGEMCERLLANTVIESYEIDIKA
jgi:phosphoribosylformylglycinamidine synthase subunit PurS